VAQYFPSTVAQFFLDVRNLSNESNIIYHEIINLLPDSQKHLLGEYENALNSMRAISDDLMYENGLKDGIRLRITFMQ